MEEVGGDPNDWWWYFASSSLLVVLSVVTMLLAICVWVGRFGLDSGRSAFGTGEGCSRDTIHSPVLVHFFPFMIVLPRYLTATPIFVKVILHPALHSVTTEMRECEARPGMT